MPTSTSHKREETQVYRGLTSAIPNPKTQRTRRYLSTDAIRTAYRPLTLADPQFQQTHHTSSIGSSSDSVQYRGKTGMQGEIL